MKYLKLVLLIVVTFLLLAACGGAAETPALSEAEVAVEPSSAETTTTSEEMADDSEEMMAESDESMDEEMTEHDEGMAELDETMEEAEAMDEEMGDEMAMSDLPAWMTTSLTDVRTGEAFTLADFAGKTVFVEPMATWCTNCRRQLGNVAQARAQLGENEDVVFVALSVETSLTDENLASYAQETGFDWAFAVVSPEMLISLADTFGQTVTNPPSTPSFIIRPDGSTTDLSTGFEGPEEILQRLEAASQS